jgi:phosphoribosylformylglycinamidine synthase
MLCVVEPRRLDDVLGVCRKWETNASAIGTVTDTRHLRVFRQEERLGDMPVSALVDECPLYDLAPERPRDALAPYAAFAQPVTGGEPPSEPDESLLALLGSANVASRRWAFEQYDWLVGSRTVRRPEQADAAVLKLAEAGLDTGRAIAVSIDGNGRRVACDPYVGAAEAVCECAANLACVGAAPLGLTNCLNFGSPEKPHVAWQLTRAVEGMGAACRALGVPIVGGNVSLYNEGPEGPIYPTPVVGMVGELPAAAAAGQSAFSRADMVALIGPFAPSLQGSELAKLSGRLSAGLPPFDLAAVRETLALVREAVRTGAVRSAHDVSEGGLACCIAESAAWGGIGVELDLDPLMRRAEVDAVTAMFGEGPGGVLVSGSREALMELSKEAARIGFLALGSVGGDAIRITAATATIDVSVEDAGRALETGLADNFGD